VVAPGLAREVTAEIADGLGEELRRLYGSVEWTTELDVDRLVVPPATLTDILDAARRKLLDSDWDLGIVVTDLPLQAGSRTVERHVSPTHGIAVVSLPALGAVHLRQRLRQRLLELVGELVGDQDQDGMHGRWGRGVLRELARETDDEPGQSRLLFVPTVVLRNLRLLLGMVRANRPWRLAARLYAALVAAIAVGAYGTVTSDIWRLATSMGAWRLSILSLVSVGVTVVAVIAVHELWERAPAAEVRDQVVLFNVATVTTVAIGIATLYLVLFALFLAGAELVIDASLFRRETGLATVGTGDYAVLAWFVASFATIGGALGVGLESDEAVREAAYSTPPAGG
jgi:hypothetical protein